MSTILQQKIIPLSQIFAEGLQVRVQTDRAHVDDLVELFGDEGVWPAALPPLDVFFDGAAYHLADGHHRLQGAQEAGCTEIPCVVHPGDRTAAIWYAVGANSSHGLKRTVADRRNAILTAKRLDPQMSNRALAGACKVSEALVRYHLAEHKKVGSSTAQFAQSEQREATPTAQDCPVEPGGDWIASGATVESTRTPWDAEPEESSHSTDGPTHLSPLADTTPTTTTPPVITPAEPSRGVDELGVPLPSEEAARAFTVLDHFADIDADLARVAKKIDTIATMPGAELLRSEYLKMTRATRDGETVEKFHSHDVANARKELSHWRPYTICPLCKGEPKQTCNICKGLHYVTESAWDQCPERLQASVKAMARAGVEPATI